MARYKGTGRADEIFGSEDGDTINGYGGSDSLYGFGGDDTLLGDRGNDLLDGGEGRDILIGGSGDDTLNLSGEDVLGRGGSGNDTINYRATNQVEFNYPEIFGGHGSDTVNIDLADCDILTHTVTINGGSQTDTLRLTANGATFQRLDEETQIWQTTEEAAEIRLSTHVDPIFGEVVTIEVGGPELADACGNAFFTIQEFEKIEVIGSNVMWEEDFAAIEQTLTGWLFTV